jgi:hypothetical protein
MEPINSEDLSVETSKLPKDSLAWRVFFVYLLLAIFLIVGINIILFLNRSEILGPQSLIISISALFFLFLLTVFAFLVFIRKLLKPLNLLISNIQTFLDGNWEQRFYHESNDELGLLTEQFNTLAEEITSLYITVEANQLEKLKSIQSVSTDHPTNIINSNLLSLDFFGDLSQAISLDTNLNDFLEIIYRHLSISLGEIRLILSLFDSNTINEPATFYFAPFERLDHIPMDVSRELISTIRSQKKSIIIGHNLSNQIIERENDHSITPVESWLGIPIPLGEDIIGALAIEDTKHLHNFSDQHLKLLQAIGSLLITQLKKEKYQQLDDVLERNHKINAITQKMRSARGTDNLLMITVKELQHALHAEKAQILIKPSANSDEFEKLVTKKSDGGNGFNRSSAP